MFEKAQRAFRAKDFENAAKSFEIAVFGCGNDTKLMAEGTIYLSLSYYYLNNMKECERNLRQAAELLEEEGLAALDISPDIRSDLERLMKYFGVAPAEKAQPAQPSERIPNQTPDKRSAAQPPPKPKNSGQGSVIKVNQVKEGDLVPLDLVETRPLVIDQTEPVYPSWARNSQIEGTIVLNALISEKGKVIKTEVIKEIRGVAGFKQAAASALRRWRFEPATVRGIKVKVWMPIAIDFKKQE
ncbi:MAG: TonB family protein [Acidobacteriota bacterium]